MTCAVIFASQLKSLPASSSICPASEQNAVRLLQYLGIGFDLLLVIVYIGPLQLDRHDELRWRSGGALYISLACLVRD